MAGGLRPTLAVGKASFSAGLWVLNCFCFSLISRDTTVRRAPLSSSPQGALPFPAALLVWPNPPSPLPSPSSIILLVYFWKEEEEGRVLPYLF